MSIPDSIAYKRLLESKLQNWLFRGKVLILVGARQVGKTTLAKKLLQYSDISDSVITFNCDNPSERELLQNRDFSFLDKLIGSKKLVFIDEGQKVVTIGQTLKLLADHYKNAKQIIVTGSSSINLLSSVQESLTGRKLVFTLYPLAMQEIYSDDRLLLLKNLHNHLIYGCYPEVVTSSDISVKEELLRELTSSYLFQDILEFQQVRNPEILRKLLSALALQIGSEVSYRELATLVGIDKNTVERYIDLLEKNFVLFRLSPYYTNQRKVIAKSQKIYFYDLGIRNALINNFNPLDMRTDVGALWENYIIVERLKARSYHDIHAKQYFWRSYSGAEIDLVEEHAGELSAYEVKWGANFRRGKQPIDWVKMHGSNLIYITRETFFDFILLK
ncbi:MAG: ATP-binding protein [Gammaproteobacteria bacterium]|nr:ATP-binding protein [Gammaproteobacteria bacterium]